MLCLFCKTDKVLPKGANGDRLPRAVRKTTEEEEEGKLKGLWDQPLRFSIVLMMCCPTQTRGRRDQWKEKKNTAHTFAYAVLHDHMIADTTHTLALNQTTNQQGK